MLLFNLFEYIDLDIKFDNNKYNQKLPDFLVMTKWMANNYFFVIKLYIWLSLARSHSQRKIDKVSVDTC